MGKRKYADVEEEMRALNGRAERLRGEFLALIDADAEAFEPLSRAYAIPKDAPERGEVMERALLRAAGPPMEIMRRCAEALGAHRRVRGQGQRAGGFPTRAAPLRCAWPR